MTDRPAVDLAALRAEHSEVEGRCSSWSCCLDSWPCPTVVLIENYIEAVEVMAALRPHRISRELMENRLNAALASLDAKVQREADGGR